MNQGALGERRKKKKWRNRYAKWVEEKKKKGHLVWETWQKRSDDRGGDMSITSQ